MATTQIFGNQVQDLTIMSSDLASGAVTPAKISAVVTDDFSFPRDITAGRDLRLSDGNELVLGNSDNAFIRYSDDHGGLVLSSETGSHDVNINVPGILAIYANTGDDGLGVFQPSIEMDGTGAVIITNNDFGSEASRALHVVMDKGIASDGDKFVFNTARVGIGSTGSLQFGYRVDTGSITHGIIKSSSGDGLLLGTGSTPAAIEIVDAGNVGIGGAPVTNGLLTLTSTSAAFVPPRMDTTQRDAITPLTAGMTIYNTDDNELNVYNGTIWVPVGSTAFPLLAPDGTAGAPSYSFENFPSTGLLCDGSLTVSVNGTATVYFEPTVISVQTNILLDDNGTVGDPTLMWSSSGNQGFYAPASGVIGYSDGSSEIFRFTSSGIDFQQNEAQNLVVHLLASNPVSPVEGQIWYNTTTKQWVGYNGTINVVLG